MYPTRHLQASSDTPSIQREPASPRASQRVLPRYNDDRVTLSQDAQRAFAAAEAAVQDAPRKADAVHTLVTRSLHPVPACGACGGDHASEVHAAITAYLDIAG